jgi:hypothetical protein
MGIRDRPTAPRSRHGQDLVAVCSLCERTANSKIEIDVGNEQLPAVAFSDDEMKGANGGGAPRNSRAHPTFYARKPVATNPERPAETDAGEPSSLSHPCACCSRCMLIIETFERVGMPRYRPTVPIRIDTS